MVQNGSEAPQAKILSFFNVVTSADICCSSPQKCKSVVNTISRPWPLQNVSQRVTKTSFSWKTRFSRPFVSPSPRTLSNMRVVPIGPREAVGRRQHTSCSILLKPGNLSKHETSWTATRLTVSLFRVELVFAVRFELHQLQTTENERFWSHAATKCTATES